MSDGDRASGILQKALSPSSQCRMANDHDIGVGRTYSDSYDCSGACKKKKKNRPIYSHSRKNALRLGYTLSDAARKKKKSLNRRTKN